MNLFLPLIVPLLILGFVYFLIIENKGLPHWMDRFSRNSGAIWTYGVVTITVLSLLKYLSSN